MKVFAASSLFAFGIRYAGSDYSTDKGNFPKDV
jgi:hypothetical protein